MTHFPTRHKNIRLRKSEYKGRQFYFVTICCQDRKKVFANSQACKWLLGIFRAEAAEQNFVVHAYCLMPDHFHFLVEGTKPTSDLLGFIKSFKIKSGRIYAKKASQLLWQKKYFDHILRKHESPESVAWYIWINPLRAGLTSAIGEYQFAGSFTGLRERLVASPNLWTPPWRNKKAPASEGGRYET